MNIRDRARTDPQAVVALTQPFPLDISPFTGDFGLALWSARDGTPRQKRRDEPCSMANSPANGVSEYQAVERHFHSGPVAYTMS
jgi:hypothetical protein